MNRIGQAERSPGSARSRPSGKTSAGGNDGTTVDLAVNRTGSLSRTAEMKGVDLSIGVERVRGSDHEAAAPRCDGMRPDVTSGEKSSGQVPIGIPSGERYLVGNLTNPRTLIHSKRLADVGHRFVFPWRSEVRPQHRTNHSEQLQRRKILGVGRDALDRRGDQDDAPPEVPGIAFPGP